MTKRITFTAAERHEFDPFTWVQHMKAAGFVFEHDTCPVKIRQPWGCQENADGSVTYIQESLQ
jgi:hypothetical protein